MTTTLHPFQGVKLKTASGGSYQKPLKSFGDLTFATQYCTGFTINLSANSPPMSCSTSEDPIGLDGGLNLQSFANSNPINFIDPFGKIETPGSMLGKMHIFYEYYVSPTEQIWNNIAQKTSVTLNACQSCIAQCTVEKMIKLCKTKIIEKALIWIAEGLFPETYALLYERVLDTIMSIHILEWTKECTERCKKVCCDKK